MESIKEILFDIFEEKLTDYYGTNSIRTSQVQMAFDIAEFLQPNNSKKIMMVEAPVGTGKSLGALIPSLLSIKKNILPKKRIVYATATINLQGQIMNSEVPLLKHLSLLKSPMLAMGKSHYYCHERFLYNKGNFTPKEQNKLKDFFTKSITGSRSELENDFGLDFSEAKWKKIELEASKRDCNFCRFSHSCSTNNHRKNFKSISNDLIVTNHDQYIVSVLNVLSETERPSIIPVNPGILVIDEAHHFIDNFLGRLEESFTIRNLKSLSKYILEESKSIFSNYIKKIELILDNKIKKVRDSDSLQGRYPVPKEIYNELYKVRTILNEAINKYETLSTFQSISHRSKTETLEDLVFLLNKILNEKYVKWVEYEELKISAISNSFPTDFRRMMDFIKQHNKIIIMSGTLTADGDFETVINQWRLKRNEVITKQFESPFDYKNQALIYVPKNVLDPRNKKFIDSGIEVIKSMIKLTVGSTLILSTSKDHMNFIWKSIKPSLEAQKIKLLLQGESGVERLTKQFKEDENSVLIGSGSFFSGFSITGTSLVSVILTKLPFPVKDDPFLKLIGQGYEEEFFDSIIYPNMVNKLNQAMGRLIRSINDYGIFTVLDSRIFTERYGEHIQKIFKNLGYTVTQSWDDVEKFYERKLKEGSNANYKTYDRKLITVNNDLDVPIEKDNINKNTTTKVDKSNSIKSKKKRGVTKAQRDFVEQLCKKENITRITSNRVVDLYTQLIDYFYYEWRDEVIEFIRENFPYRDEKEKVDLVHRKGKRRRTVMPLCSKFGCEGNCLSQKEISNYLKNTYQPEEIRFINRDEFCRILVSPTEILENEEFRPD